MVRKYFTWTLLSAFAVFAFYFSQIKPVHAAGSGETVKVWVFLKDKGPQQSALLKKARNFVTPRSLKRRMKVRGNQPVDAKDLPLYAPYVRRIGALVEKIRVKSKWLNALSVEVNSDDLATLQALPFVKKIQPVRAYRRHIPPQPQEKSQQKALPKSSSGQALDYGSSATQIEQINVHLLHEQGYYGQGVLIAMLDDGFNLLNHHIAFDSLDVQATYDFIHDDESVDDSEFDATEGTHGTKTLSTIGGYVPGELIGPAFKATYLLAKTEVDATETPVEEDYWVAGLEWADSLGADLVSSSLGYIDWYTWENMDGETAVTTVAADQAVHNGMLVFNSAGNEGNNDSHNTLIAPADGDSVMAIAAVTSSGERSSFSSVGPSADGRTKPDLAAMGSSVYTASSSDSTGFVYSSGTSFSCPLSAGAAALLLCAHPELTPVEVQQALKATASQADAPDNLLGWGIIDAAAALDYIDSVSGFAEKEIVPQSAYLAQNYPNPFGRGQGAKAPRSTVIPFRLRIPAQVELAVFNTLGQRVKTLVLGARLAGSYRVTFDAADLASGIYIYRLTTDRGFSRVRKMILLR